MSAAHCDGWDIADIASRSRLAFDVNHFLAGSF